MTNGVVNPAAIAGQVYGIAGAGISLGLLAGMARGISDITWKEPTRTRRSQPKYKKSKKKEQYAFASYKPYYVLR